MIKRLTKAIKKIAKDSKEEFKKGYKSTTGTIIGYMPYSNTQIPIIYSPDSVSTNNSIFATVNVYRGEYRIVVDDLYMNAPEQLKAFANQHEIGHLYSLPNNHTLNDEIMADKYAAQQVGNIIAIEALNYIWGTACTCNEVLKCVTIPSRLKELGADVSSMYIIGANGKTFYEEDLRMILNGGELK